MTFPLSHVDLPNGSEVVVEPRSDSKTFSQYEWPLPQMSTVVAGEISLPNSLSYPITVHRNDKICQIRSTSEVVPFTSSSPTPSSSMHAPVGPFSSDVILDPQLNAEDNLAFKKLHSDFHDVFQPVVGRYNDYSGKLRARVNIGDTKPPAKKLHAPNYSKGNQDLLQDKFDELEKQGIFV